MAMSTINEWEGIDENTKVSEEQEDVEHQNSKSKEENHLKSESTPVYSTAVVKYSSFLTPVTYAVLQYLTNLNHPPSNWLRHTENLPGSFHFGKRSHGHFSSFKMANMFTDYIGEVDVVSDAENIKRLLKIPYSKGSLSMMVHPVGRTLLIDEFDIHENLLRSAKREWRWLRTFYFVTVLESMASKQEKATPNTRSKLQTKSLVSKFLYHSLNESEEILSESKPSQPALSRANVASDEGTCQASNEGALLPNEEEEQEFSSAPQFARTVLWTFENIRMLIGTDMPIFGSEEKPCVSLRLRDMAKPISVLTGIDYWLDNLMCNVPEVLMCYHLDGIVQKYELIKTEDMPHFENSRFSSKEVRDVAQNILSFLKANATKAGHTYWLFKAKDNDVVKLYDLTSLCADIMDDPEENPFTLPVALLLFRVAQNLLKQSDTEKMKRGTIRALLTNCLALINHERYAKMSTSAHLILSELYTPMDGMVHPGESGLADDSDDETESEQWEDEEDCCFNTSVGVDIQKLCMPESVTDNVQRYKPIPFTGTLLQRSRLSMEHVIEGLKCLKRFEESYETKIQEEKQAKQKLLEEQNPTMAKPLQPIPLKYEPLGKTKRDTDPSDLKTMMISMLDSKLIRNNYSIPQWKRHMALMLLQKASVAYAVDADAMNEEENQKRALQCALISLLCCEVFDKHLPNTWNSCTHCGIMKSLVAEIYFRSHLEPHKYLTRIKSKLNLLENDEIILDNLAVFDNELKDSKRYKDLVYNPDITGDNVLLTAHRCYEDAMELLKGTELGLMLMKKFGAVKNELGSAFTAMVDKLIYEETVKSEQQNINGTLMILYMKSMTYFQEGLELFKRIDDTWNVALLCCNLGRLHRSVAFYFDRKDSERNNTSFSMAFDCYEKAWESLTSRQSCPDVWDTVTWEYSSALMTLANQYHESGYGCSNDKTELEIIEHYNKTLNCCSKGLACDLRKAPIYLFRLGMTHSFIAESYEKMLKNCDPTEPRYRMAMPNVRTHYAKACDCFEELDLALQYFQTQAARICLLDYLTNPEKVPGRGLKPKLLNSMVDIYLRMQPILTKVASRSLEVRPLLKKQLYMSDSLSTSWSWGNTFSTEELEMIGKKEAESDLEMADLIIVLFKKVQAVLKSLVQIHVGVSKKGHKNIDMYKKMYQASLIKYTSEKDVTKIAAEFLGVLTKIREVSQLETKVKNPQEMKHT